MQFPEVTYINYCGSSTQGILMMRERAQYLRPWREFIFRANPGETHQFFLFSTLYGQPDVNVTVNMFIDPTFGRRDPEDGVTGWQDSAQTNGSGIATFNLTAGFIGMPRIDNNIDGQVYQFSYNISGSEVISPLVQPSEQILSDINAAAILVFSNVSYTRPYTWVEDTEPIFSQYAQLYPVMMQIVNMSNYTDVKLMAAPLLYAMGIDVSHPNYMPVTRDLSAAKRNVIIEWLSGGCLYDQNGTTPTTQFPECLFSGEGNDPMQNQDAGGIDIPLPESCMQGIQEGEPPTDSFSSSLTTYGDIFGSMYTSDRFPFVREDGIRDLSAFRFENRAAASFPDFYIPEGDECAQQCMDVDWQRLLRKENLAIEDLRCMLQTAIRLEFSTLPPYLTASFSIREGCNVEVEDLIRSVVLQEMLHMAQAANLLIALGGRPIINSRCFAPVYPGPLPGGVMPGLIVRLERVTREYVRSFFMPIELPGETNVALNQTMYTNNTIGDFYASINMTLNQIYERYGQSIFCDPENCTQVEWSNAPADTGGGILYIVNNITTAHAAINQIVTQGEGVGPFDPTEGLGDELAHYYKFEEIVCGNRLVRNTTAPGLYSFTGAPLPFDTSGVYPMMDDPCTGKLPLNTNASYYSRVFNEVYVQLLNRLHQTFNGDPDGFGDMVSIMFSLKIHAKLLMRSYISESSVTAGPAWEYESITNAAGCPVPPTETPPTEPGQCNYNYIQLTVS